MTSKAAQILDGTVNVVVADQDYAVAQGWIPLDDDSPVQTGWRYEGGQFRAPLSDDPGERDGLVGYILTKRWEADDHVASYRVARGALAGVEDGTVTSEADVDAIFAEG